ncbi:VanZ family protein [Butyricicoccus faecihominis]|uniref:VanZ family protein n=1 Tax=Butyricicoccus faecihominis TaxID=1712515 RepID=UPI00247939EC|nr:VanZ family protein [Butyricicoccus faecihominis]MCQ5130557.1 VanZ family protein [Butyricicoccus faecihominis]
MKKHGHRIAVLVLLLYGIVLARLKIWKSIGTFGENPTRHREIVNLFSDGLVEIEWNPFHTLQLSCTTIPELMPVVLFNFLIFLPVGFLLPLCLHSKKCGPCLLWFLIISLILNLTSFALQHSILDLGDILLNVLGGLFGWALYTLLVKKMNQKQNERISTN